MSKKVEVLQEAKELLSQMNLNDILEYDTDSDEDSSDASEEIPDEVERSSSRNNLTWIIVNEENSGYYYWGENNMSKMLRSKLFGYINDLDQDMERSHVLKKTDNCMMWQVHDRFAGMEYVECWGQFDNGYYFLIRSPLESIKESAAISNSFYFIVGAIIVVISGLVILVVTNRITRPISELTKLSERMSDLDFDARYQSWAGNEIDVLGDNFNKMSRKLESTISELKSANNKLQKDIEDSIREDTRAVILDASGIGSIDITAADRLEILYRSLKEKGIRFYITEHIAELNEQMRKLGLGYLIEEGCARRTIHIALKDMGIKRPYPLEGGVDNEERSASRKRVDNRVQEFVWAFGSDTEAEIEKQIMRQIEQLKQNGDVENLFHGRWAHMEELDQDEWLEHLEEHLKEIVNISGKDERTLAARFEEHRKEVHERIAKDHPELAERFHERRHLLDEHLRERRPEVYDLVISLREAEEKRDRNDQA